MPGCELAYQATLDWRTLVSKNDIDGVLIATPASTHAEIALPFIERGLPVFIEKPMANSLADAEKMYTAAQKSGSIIFIGHIHLYNPAFIKTKELSKTIGPIRTIVGEGANNGPYREDCSAMWDWAPHDLSMILDIMGEMPENVQAWGTATLRPGTTLYDTTEIKMHFKNGSMGIVFSSWLMPQKRKRLTIVGTQSSVVYDDTLAEKKVALYENMGPKVEGNSVTFCEPAVSYPAYDAGAPLSLELEAFAHSIVTKEKSKNGAAEGLAVVKILEAAETSITSGGKRIKIT